MKLRSDRSLAQARHRALRAAVVARVAFGCLTLLLAATACKSHRPPPHENIIGLLTPAPPAFLTGPIAALLTNAGSFSARVAMETNSRTGPLDFTSGTLLGRGGKLLLALEPHPTALKQHSAASFMFIWDVAEGQGFLLSEALQGYAPLATNAQRCVALTVEPASVPPQKLDGQSCQRYDATARMEDGSVTGLHLWRAAALKGLPLRISPAGDSPLPALRLSRVRFEPLPPDLFAPPASFTKYDNSRALMTELVARQRNLSLKPKPEEEPLTQPADGRFR
jgi:hypothetical protein